MAEEALVLAIKNASLDEHILKALRLTCKRTKVAADDKVWKFTLTMCQEPEAVQRSGLLNNITELYLNLYMSDPWTGIPDNPQNVSHALGLLNLAVGVSKPLLILKVAISASPETLRSCSSVLINYWESLQELKILENCSMPSFLSGVLGGGGGRPGLPALKNLQCQNPSVDDIDAIYNSGLLGNLTTLAIKWSEDAYIFNVAPAMKTAMRTLLHNATTVENLHVVSSTFEFFDCEQLNSLKTLEFKALSVDDYILGPVLARPWTTLQSLCIDNPILRGPDLIRIFEAADTLPILKSLSLCDCLFGQNAMNALSCLRRPQLEEFSVVLCTNGHVLVSKLAELMKANDCALPFLRSFLIHCANDDDGDGDATVCTTEALSEFLSCPCMETLETLCISDAQLDTEDTGLLYDIANFCPKLKDLDIGSNRFGRPAVAVLLGYGLMGAWPKLEKLGGMFSQGGDAEDPNCLYAEHTYLRRLDLQWTLRRVWPKLECY